LACGEREFRRLKSSCSLAPQYNARPV